MAWNRNVSFSTKTVAWCTAAALCLGPLAPARAADGFWSDRRRVVTTPADRTPTILTSRTSDGPSFLRAEDGVLTAVHAPGTSAPGPRRAGDRRLPAVLLLQEAHGHADGARHAAEILRRFLDTLPPNSVVVAASEGAVGDLPLAPLRRAPHTSARDAGLDALLAAGRLTPEEFVAVRDQRLRVVGMEDPTLYRENRRIRRETAEMRRGFLSALALEEADLRRTESTLPAAARRLLAIRRAVAGGDLSPLDDTDDLWPAARWARDFPECARARSARAWDRETARRGLDTEAGRRALAADPAAAVPFLQRWAEARRLNPAALADQFDRWADALETRCASRMTSDVRRHLDRRRALDTLHALWSLRLTPARWDALRWSPLPLDLFPTLARLRTLGEDDVMRFYELAAARNRAMLENALAAARTAGADHLVLVAGGFHAPGLERLLRSAAVTHWAVAPSLAPDATLRPPDPLQGPAGASEAALTLAMAEALTDSGARTDPRFRISRPWNAAVLGSAPGGLRRILRKTGRGLRLIASPVRIRQWLTLLSPTQRRREESFHGPRRMERLRGALRRWSNTLARVFENLYSRSGYSTLSGLHLIPRLIPIHSFFFLPFDLTPLTPGDDDEPARRLIGLVNAGDEKGIQALFDSLRPADVANARAARVLLQAAKESGDETAFRRRFFEAAPPLAAGRALAGLRAVAHRREVDMAVADRDRLLRWKQALNDLTPETLRSWVQEEKTWLDELQKREKALGYAGSFIADADRADWELPPVAPESLKERVDKIPGPGPELNQYLEDRLAFAARRLLDLTTSAGLDGGENPRHAVEAWTSVGARQAAEWLSAWRNDLLQSEPIGERLADQLDRIDQIRAVAQGEDHLRHETLEGRLDDLGRRPPSTASASDLSDITRRTTESLHRPEGAAVVVALPSAAKDLYFAALGEAARKSGETILRVSLAAVARRFGERSTTPMDSTQHVASQILRWMDELQAAAEAARASLVVDLDEVPVYFRYMAHPNAMTVETLGLTETLARRAHRNGLVLVTGDNRHVRDPHLVEFQALRLESSKDLRRAMIDQWRSASQRIGVLWEEAFQTRLEGLIEEGWEDDELRALASLAVADARRRNPRAPARVSTANLDAAARRLKSETAESFQRALRRGLARGDAHPDRKSVV